MRPETDEPLDEHALRAAHATVTRILGAIEEYVYTGEFLPDGGYQVVFAGPCREQFLGLSAEEAETATWRYYVHPDDLDVFDGSHDRARHVGRLDVDYRMVGADGVLRWVRDRGRMREEGGRYFLDGSVLDVTEMHVVQEELQAARAEADRLAHLDHLTGAANRRSLHGLLRQAATRPHGVLSIDLDRFKQVNDLFGHAAGDAVLVAVADSLRASVRAVDAVVRMGGEEFLVLISDVDDEHDLAAIAESIRRRVEDVPVVVGDEALHVTISIGAALACASPADPEAVLIHADRALYEAKRGGRNRVRLGSLGAVEPRRERAGHDTETVRIARAMAVAAAAADGLDREDLDQVADLAAQVARQLGRSAAEIMRCRLAGLVHDVGKIGVPAAVMHEPGPLSDDQWAVMRGHVERGEELLRDVPELRIIAHTVRHHHERFDGSGYPDGLAGTTIPIEARILAAVDTWSALRRDRPYRAALDEPAASVELRRVAGQQLDPAVVEALCTVLSAGLAPRASTRKGTWPSGPAFT